MAVATFDFYSKVLNMNTCAYVFFPERRLQYPRDREGKEYPVLYLLHGHCHDHTTWIRNSRIEWYLKDEDVIVVCPDGSRGYFVDGVLSHQYLTYITQELPVIVKNWFRISSKPEDTMIAGFSMGGYGALQAGLCYPNQYGKVGAMSAAINICAVQDSADVVKAGGRPMDEDHFKNMEAIFGGQIEGSKYDLRVRLKECCEMTGSKPAFYMVCGTEDYLYEQNKSFASEMEAAEAYGIHTIFKEAPGKHNWDFWDRELIGVLKFMGLLDQEYERK